MTADAFNRALQALNIGQSEFARLIEVDPRTVRRYASGAPIPKAVEFTLLLMCRHGLDADQLRRWSDQGI